MVVLMVDTKVEVMVALKAVELVGRLAA